MGQNPNRTPSEHPIQSNHYNRKPKMGGEFTNPNQNGIPWVSTHGQVRTAIRLVWAGGSGCKPWVLEGTWATSEAPPILTTK